MLSILTNEESRLLRGVMERSLDLASDNYEVKLMVDLNEAIQILGGLKQRNAEEVIE